MRVSMRMSSRYLSLPYVAPIPVGHRVEVVWLLKEAGLYDSELRVVPGEMAVRDIDTGVMYGRQGDYTELDRGAAVGDRVEGKVVACRVLTHSSGSAQHVSTELWIDEAASA